MSLWCEPNPTPASTISRCRRARSDWFKRGPYVIDDLRKAHAFDLGRLGIGVPLCGLCRVGGELLGKAWRSLFRDFRRTPLKGLLDAGQQVLRIEIDGLAAGPIGRSSPSSDH